MKFFVNFLSAFRICASFAIIPLLMLGLYTTTLIVYFLAAASDWFDGYLARKYAVCTKIGGVMDHTGDKLLVANTLIMLAVMMPVWFIVVPTIVMIARDLYISGLREFLGTQKIEMPVPHARFSLGKVKTTLQMVATIAFLTWLVIPQMISIAPSNRTLIVIFEQMPSIAVTILWLALIASVVSAAQYTQTFIKKLQKIK